MNRIQYENKNNFLRWFNPNLGPQPERPLIEMGYLYDPFRQSMPVYVKGEQYSFYINFDTNPLTRPEDVGEKYKLRIINAKDELQETIGQVGKLVLSTTGIEYPYHLYCKYFDMSTITYTGVYRFAICLYDTPDVITYISNCIMIAGDDVKDFTNYMQFRNDYNLLNFYYELLPVPLVLEPFYQRFRLVLNKIKFSFDSEIKQYRRASDRSLRNYNYDIDKIIKLETHWFSEDDHDAAVTMLQHRELYANTIEILQKSDYNVDSKANLNISKGEVDVIRTGVIYSFTDPISEDPDFNDDFNNDFNIA